MVIYKTISGSLCISLRNYIWRSYFLSSSKRFLQRFSEIFFVKFTQFLIFNKTVSASINSQFSFENKVYFCKRLIGLVHVSTEKKNLNCEGRFEKKSELFFMEFITHAPCPGSWKQLCELQIKLWRYALYSPFWQDPLRCFARKLSSFSVKTYYPFI